MKNIQEQIMQYKPKESKPCKNKGQWNEKCGIWAAFTACTMLCNGQKTSHFLFWRLHLLCSGLHLV